MPAGDARFVLDNTAISNFSSVGRTGILRERYGGRLFVTGEVLAEAERGPNPKAVVRALEEGWLKILPYAEPRQRAVFADLRGRGFGAGEASALAACSPEGAWVFVSDDKDARDEAWRRGVGVVGTYGVLARQVVEGRMGLEEGNALLERMIDAGFRSHSDDLAEEVERLAASGG